MRSRYCAFVKNLADYLKETWHPTTRPPELDLDQGIVWTGLEIISTHMGKESDSSGSVTFTAGYINKGIPGAFTEASEFIRQSKQWYYLKGDIIK
jgi:SEC-C motif-containing protein